MGLYENAQAPSRRAYPDYDSTNVRALRILGPGVAEVQTLPDPEPRAGWSVVDVTHLGLCGTDAALFDGSMPYLHDGTARYPLVPGHEWSGTVRRSDRWPTGARVTGGTFIGCGRCGACAQRQVNICLHRAEVGVRGDVAGAAAEQVSVPDELLVAVPEGVTLADATAAEPLSTVLEAVYRSGVVSGVHACVWGTGTIGLLLVQALRARQVLVSAVGIDPHQLALARDLGAQTYPAAEAPVCDVAFDATGAGGVPAAALERTRPGGVLVLIAVPTDAPGLQVPRIVHHVQTVTGVLGGPSRVAEAVQVLATGEVRADLLRGPSITLEDVPAALQMMASGTTAAGAPPKILVSIGTA